jgi:hypothetical protein
MPIWDGEGGAIPPPRLAATSETYQPADAAQEHGATSVGATAGASATGSRPPGESGPAGSGWPRE